MAIVPAIFDSAAVVKVTNDNDGWSYAPWCSGTVTTGGKPRVLTLYLGGRGRIETDQGEILFSFDARELDRALKGLVPR